MRISVTQEDIDNGKRMDCHSCPIALAIKRATGKSKVTVGLDNVYIYDLSSDDRARCMLPPVAYSFIDRFDSGWTLKPFEFDLNV